MGPSAEVAHRLATRREDRQRHEVNAVFFRLEVHMERWRAHVALSRAHPMGTRMPNFRRDFLQAQAASAFATAVVQLDELGEY